MLKPILSPPDTNTSEHIRARQLDAVDQLVPPMMVANVVCAGGLTALLYSAQKTPLLIWFGVVAVLSSARFVQARRNNARPPRLRAGRRAVVRTSIQAAVMALCFTSVPVWLLGQTAGMTYTIIICQLTGTLWAGSLVLATVLPAAIAFIAVTGIVICAGLLSVSHDNEHLFLVLLFMVGAATALWNVLQRSPLFAATHRQQLDLRRQADVITLLLKDYEEQTSDWLWETDTALVVKAPSSRFLQVLGRPFDAIEGVALDRLLANPGVAGNGAALLLLRSQAASALSFRDLVIPFEDATGPRWWALSGRPVVDERGAVAGYRGVAADVTASKLAEARLAHLAHYDALTDLPNRSFFYSSLDRALRARDAKAAIISIDIDGFKAVNDRFGHPVGDAILIELARRLRDLVGREDLVARFGGDEFIILDTHVSDAGTIEGNCRALLQIISAPYEILGETVAIGASIGIAMAPADGVTTGDLLKNAASALYRAKADGRGTFRFFELDMDRRVQGRQRMIQDLRAAIGRGELTLHYQPFVSSDSGRVTGYEALVRWLHPLHGQVPPSVFIPLAEESGVIAAIGTWVLETACREAAHWPADQRVSVNVSPLQFRDRGLPDIILAALQAAAFPAARLEIEVTETLLITDADGTREILSRIRSNGVRIALDDFGTGYSSLSYLRRFPFDRIKIDRSFVQLIETQHDSQVIVQAICDIARGLNMTITAEGVETAGQGEQLKSAGCDELQGYLYSVPKKAEDVDHSLRIPGLAQEPTKAPIVALRRKRTVPLEPMLND